MGDILTFSDPSKRKGDGEEEDEDEYELPFYFFEPLRWLGREVPKNRRGRRKNGNQCKKILCAGVSQIYYIFVFFPVAPPTTAPEAAVERIQSRAKIDMATDFLECRYFFKY